MSDRNCQAFRRHMVKSKSTKRQRMIRAAVQNQAANFPWTPSETAWTSVIQLNLIRGVISSESAAYVCVPSCALSTKGNAADSKCDFGATVLRSSPLMTRSIGLLLHLSDFHPGQFFIEVQNRRVVPLALAIQLQTFENFHHLRG
jgi:hypothetical protein